MPLPTDAALPLTLTVLAKVEGALPQTDALTTPCKPPFKPGANAGLNWQLGLTKAPENVMVPPAA